MPNNDTDELGKILNDYTIHGVHAMSCNDNAYMVIELNNRITAWARTKALEAKPEKKKPSDTRFTQVPLEVSDDNNELNITGGYSTRMQRPYNDGWNDSTNQYADALTNVFKEK